MIDLDLLIAKANELPAFPASTVRLTQLATNPNSNLSDVAEIIAYDQALTVKVLRAANSAASGSATRVTTVHAAVTRIGAAQLMTLAVAAGARPHLQKPVPAYGLDEGALWRHSVVAAVVAESLPSFCSVEMPAEVFTAALLHDVGKPVMGRFLTDQIVNFIAHARDVDHLCQFEAEMQILGVHHGEIGGIIAQHWQLPSRVVQGITHHRNLGEDNDVVCDFVCMANQVAMHIEANLDGQQNDCICPSDVMARVGMEAGELNSLCNAAATRFAEVSLRYNAV